MEKKQTGVNQHGGQHGIQDMLGMKVHEAEKSVGNLEFFQLALTKEILHKVPTA